MAAFDPQRVLEERFGLTAFRPGQREAIDALLADGRLLCIQPTGHGKSLLYQLPASQLPGITLVISPLLALVRDQVSQLESRFSIHAVAMNSDQDDKENAAAMRAASAGTAKILVTVHARCCRAGAGVRTREHDLTQDPRTTLRGDREFGGGVCR